MSKFFTKDHTLPVLTLMSFLGKKSVLLFLLLFILFFLHKNGHFSFLEIDMLEKLLEENPTRAGVFLLIPTKAVKDAYLAIIIMIGALGAHIFKLGFDGMNGQLGIMAVVVLLTSIGVVVTHKK